MSDHSTSNGGFFASAGDLGGLNSGSTQPTPPPYPPAPAAQPTPPPYQPVPAPRPAPAPAPQPVPAPAAPAYVPAPAGTATAPKTKARGPRISVKNELKLLLRQGILVLFGEKRNLIISLLFPFIAAAIMVWIAGENMFVSFEATKSGCFILVCAAIWGGLFNSIQSLVKERENIKRDYVSGALRIECYMGSRALIQLVLCFIQSAVLTVSFPAIEWVHGNSMPSSGLLGLPVIFEFFITLFLIMYASDTLGLLISSIVRKEELASKLAPYILIAQLLFSGVLFTLEGGAKGFSSIMISRWGMEALGSICDLNATPTATHVALIDNGWDKVCIPDRCCGLLGALELPKESEAFEATSEHFVLVLLIMLAFVVVPLIVGDLMLHRVKKDGRD